MTTNDKLHCKFCDYSTEKPSTMAQHIHRKHREQQRIAKHGPPIQTNDQLITMKNQELEHCKAIFAAEKSLLTTALELSKNKNVDLNNIIKENEARIYENDKNIKELKRELELSKKSKIIYYDTEEAQQFKNLQNAFLSQEKKLMQSIYDTDKVIYVATIGWKAGHFTIKIGQTTDYHSRHRKHKSKFEHYYLTYFIKSKQHIDVEKMFKKSDLCKANQIDFVDATNHTQKECYQLTNEFTLSLVIDTFKRCAEKCLAEAVEEFDKSTETESTSRYNKMNNEYFQCAEKAVTEFDGV